MVQSDHEIEHSKPDSLVVDKKNKQYWTVDVACPADNKICDKEREKQKGKMSGR